MSIVQVGGLRPDTPPATVAANTKVDVAYEQVRRWILIGDLAPGAVLDQGVLACSIGVSTTPMREALRRLEAEELLTVQAHRRVIVSHLSSQELNDIYDVRFELDPMAVRLAATRLTSATIKELRALEKKRPRDVADRSANNHAFHGRVYEASGNAVLIRICASLALRSMRYRSILVRSEDTSQKAHAEHLLMLDAMEHHDGDLLAKLTLDHLAKAKQAIAVHLNAED